MCRLLKLATSWPAGPPTQQQSLQSHPSFPLPVHRQSLCRMNDEPLGCPSGAPVLAGTSGSYRPQTMSHQETNTSSVTHSRLKHSHCRRSRRCSRLSGGSSSRLDRNWHDCGGLWHWLWWGWDDRRRRWHWLQGKLGLGTGLGVRTGDLTDCARGRLTRRASVGFRGGDGEN